MSERVARSHELVAKGCALAAAARVLHVTRQAVYRVPQPHKRPDASRRAPVHDVEAAIVEVAEANPTDGYRLVTAWVCRKLGRAINGKRRVLVSGGGFVKRAAVDVKLVKR